MYFFRKSVKNSEVDMERNQDFIEVSRLVEEVLGRKRDVRVMKRRGKIIERRPRVISLIVVSELGMYS